MEIGLIALAIILASLLGWLLKQSFNTTPWIADVAPEADHQAPFNARPKLVALTTFLAVATSFFALILSASSLRMDFGDWIPLTEPTLLWFNTAVLVLASVAFQWTRNVALNDRVSQMKLGLMASGVLTAAFLIGQMTAWQQLSASGQFLTSNPSNSFFFLLTGTHAIHILGGMYVWGRATLKAYSGGAASAVKHSVELCTIYWHFLLLVWLIFFGLMLST